MAPFLDNLDPASGSPGNLATTNVYLEIKDTGSGVDLDSVVLKIDSVICWSGDSQQGAFVVTKTSVTNGYGYEINPNARFDIAATVTVEVYAEDQTTPTPGVLDTSYTFDIAEASSVTYSFDVETDLSGPLITNKDPAPFTTGVDRDKAVSFHIEDTPAGVDLNSTYIYVDAVLVYDGSTSSWHADFDPGSSITGDSSDYTVELVKDVDWDSNATVQIHVVTEDAVGNPTDESWSFEIEDYEGPTISANSPTGTGVAHDTNISFVTEDDGSGVDLATLEVVVGGSSAISGGVPQAGWDGPGTSITPNAGNGYDVVIDPTSDLPSYSLISVTVDVDDNDGNSANFGWSFETEDYEGVHVQPQSPTNGEMNVDVDTNIVILLEDDDEVVATSILVEVDRGSGFETAFDYNQTPKFRLGYNGAASLLEVVGGAYTITIDPETAFSLGTTIQVRVTAEDPEGNPERL